MPILREKAQSDCCAISKIISVVTKLPSEVIRTMMNSVSYEDKCEIVALLVRDHNDKIREGLSQLLKQNGINAALGEVSISSVLELSVTLSNLNYAALITRYRSMIQDGLLTQENPITEMLATPLRLPNVLLYGALAKIPQNRKDEAVAYLINKNSNRIIEGIESAVRSQNIHIRFGKFEVET